MAVDGFGLPLDASLINKDVKTMNNFQPSANTLAYATPCGAQCLDKDVKVATCGGGAPCSVPGVPDCGGTRQMCINMEQYVTYQTGNANQNIRDCCTSDDLGPGNGCGWNYCPGSDMCMDAAEKMCTTCRGSARDPCDPNASGPVMGVQGDKLCDSMKTYDFDRWKNMMEKICLDADGKPLDVAYGAKCLEFLNDPQVQAAGTKLQQYCMNQPIIPSTDGTPVGDNMCGCYRNPAFYDKFMAALARQWVIPEGLIDGRPVCLYPGCRGALVVDKTTIQKTQCKDANIALCMQKVMVNNGGEITGNIQIQQGCPSGSGIMPRGAGKKACAVDADCDNGMKCDYRLASCVLPNEISTLCTTDSDCVTSGRVCGAPNAQKQRFCTTAVPQGPQNSAGASSAGPPVFVWVIVAVVAAIVLGVCVWLWVR